MGTIIDYLEWRGDIPFSAVEFNEIDALILCQITYLNFDGLLSDANFSNQIPISELAEKFKNSPDFETRADTGLLINEETSKLLELAGKSERFKDVLITGYMSIIDLSKEEQFAAATYIIQPKLNYVVYRGTDDTIVGFKEDFNLAIMDEVPAQKDAIQYLELAASSLKGNFYVGGHSKGGNLAIYASAMVRPETKKRVSLIYNMDGPGFSDKRLTSQEFYEIIPRIRSFYPHFSIVGMIFNHAGAYSVVESEQTGIMQHDPFSWHLCGKSFVLLNDFDEASSFFNKVLNKWILSLSKEQVSQFIETLYNILEATDARTNSEIETNILKNSFKIFKAWMDTPADIRDAVENTVRQLYKIAHRQLPSPQEWFEKNTKRGLHKVKENVAKMQKLQKSQEAQMSSGKAAGKSAGKAAGKSSGKAGAGASGLKSAGKASGLKSGSKIKKANGKLSEK